MKGRIALAAVIAGLVVLPAVTFAVAKSRPHPPPPAQRHAPPGQAQTAPALSV